MSDVKQVDPFHVKGPDGVIRSLDEHYDGMQDVAKDPYGAWLAIQNLCARLEAVEKELVEMTAVKDIHQTRRAEYFARAERAEAALATARRDALEEAAHLMPRYFGVWSSTGVHIGVWDDGATAAKVLEEYPQGVMRDLIDVEAIRALANEAETSARGMP